MHCSKVGRVLLSSCLYASVLLANACTCSGNASDLQPLSPQATKKPPRIIKNKLEELIVLLEQRIVEGEKRQERVAEAKDLLQVFKNIQAGSMQANGKFKPDSYPTGEFTLATFAAYTPQLDSALRIKCFKYAKAKGVSFKEFTAWGKSILHLLVKEPDFVSLQWVLLNTAAKDLITAKTTNSDQETPLKTAVILSIDHNSKATNKTWLQIIELLLQHGAKDDKVDVQELLNKKCDQVSPAGNMHGRKG
ncbi:MAG: hypothetical protein AAFQ01_03305, partial [Bacteroidota bacterium]